MTTNKNNYERGLAIRFNGWQSNETGFGGSLTSPRFDKILNKLVQDLSWAMGNGQWGPVK
ncbi:hypothetical protein [Gloeothece verrucosa]|uniref:hypothetical protein n=1 Tax=Gloeothece verrucosa TaxID=2546359 RepID=UPI0002F6F1AE|nr:hypothetical protein [Gloeothece verrucosa]